MEQTETAMNASTGLPDKSSWITPAYLELYLTKGFAVAAENFAHEYALHPQDVSLIESVAAQIESGPGTSITVAPFLNGLSIAFLMRALSVASVNKSNLTLYSADDSVPRYYRNLSYIANRVRAPISKVHPLRIRRTLRELSMVNYPTILVLDARYTRGWRELDPLPWKGIDGPKIFLSFLDDYRLESLLTNVEVRYAGSCGQPGMPFPDSLQDTSKKLDNYSKGVTFYAETVPGNDDVLANLERAFQNLHQKGRDIPQIQMQLAQARRFNHFVQNSVLPLSMYQEAAHGLGAYTISEMLRVVRGGIPREAPALVRGAFYRFVRAADAAMGRLELGHPPKVSWFKKFLLERKEPIAVPCGSHVEKAAFEYWARSPASEGCAEVKALTRADLRTKGYAVDVVAAGPPSEEDLAYLLGGVSSRVSVLVYPWQARHWNLLTKRASKLIAGVAPIPEPPVEEEQEETEEGVDWAAPAQGHSSGEELLRREFAEGIAKTLVLIPTDAGTLEYEEDALVPTLEVDKFVDREAKLLHEGNVVILQTGGNLIDASRTVDALAESNPVLSEAAQEANMWREVLYTYIQSQKMSYKEIHRKLFPNNEVNYGAVKRWVMNQVKIGPQYDNLALLLSRIGVSRAKADEMARAVHRYRSYRFRVYRYIFGLWTRYASKLYELEDDLTAEDEKIDAEFGLSLASLEQLVTFAKITGKPILKRSATNG